jgi:hypothetical protein
MEARHPGTPPLRRTPFHRDSNGRVLGVWIEYEGFPRVSVKINAKTNKILVCFPGSDCLPRASLAMFALDAFLPDLAGASLEPRTPKT